MRTHVYLTERDTVSFFLYDAACVCRVAERKSWGLGNILVLFNTTFQLFDKVLRVPMSPSESFEENPSFASCYARFVLTDGNGTWDPGGTDRRFRSTYPPLRRSL